MFVLGGSVRWCGHYGKPHNNYLIHYNFRARGIGLYSLNKHEDMHSIPATHIKPSMVAWVCNPSAEEVQRGRSLRLVCQPAYPDVQAPSLS